MDGEMDGWKERNRKQVILFICVSTSKSKYRSRSMMNIKITGIRERSAVAALLALCGWQPLLGRRHQRLLCGANALQHIIELSTHACVRLCGCQVRFDFLQMLLDRAIQTQRYRWVKETEIQNHMSELENGIICTVYNLYCIEETNQLEGKVESKVLLKSVH